MRRTLLTALAAVLVAAPAAPAAEVGLVPDLTWGISAAEQDRTAAAIGDLGAKWVRLNVQWKYWEYRGPSITIQDSGSRRAADRSVELARAAGSKVVLMVYNAPDWAAAASSSEGQVPRSPQDYANFMRTLAAHYRGKVDAYEIWNEPDLQRFWSTGPSATQYTALLKAAYAGVKAGDPDAKVVFGGLSWDYTRDGSYLSRAYSYGAKGHFDVLAIHPYPQGDLARWLGWIRAARATMVANGDAAKPIWLTEFGANTSTRAYDPANGAWQGGITEAAQAELLTRTFTLLESEPYVGVVCWYNLRNNYWSGDDPSSVEGSFGLLRTDFSPKPAYYAFKRYATGAALPLPVPAPAPVPANAAPTVTLTAPTDGSSFSRSLKITATAGDDERVAKVVFAVDGKVVATDTSAPYETWWGGAKKASSGRYTISATAYDEAGLSASDRADVVKGRTLAARRGSR